MAFDLRAREAQEPTDELAGAPLGEMITQLAESIAEGQARLDLSSAELLKELAETKVAIVPEVRRVIEANGQVRFEQAEPKEVSLLELGMVPTFYAFSEATVEVAMDLQVVERSTETGSTKKKPFLFGSTRSLRTERRLNRDLRVHSKVKATLTPVPAPPLVGPTRSVDDRREGGGA